MEMGIKDGRFCGDRKEVAILNRSNTIKRKNFWLGRVRARGLRWGQG
jgi:hypothetical protein